VKLDTHQGKGQIGVTIIQLLNFGIIKMTSIRFYEHCNLIISESNHSVRIEIDEAGSMKRDSAEDQERISGTFQDAIHAYYELVDSGYEPV